MMEIRLCNENSLLWWKFFILVEIHHHFENLSLGWKLMAVIRKSWLQWKTNLCDEDSLLDEKSYILWKIIIFMKFIIMIENYCCDEKSTLWWKFVNIMKFISVIKINCFNWRQSMWWKVIILIKIHHFEKKSSLWRRFCFLRKTL